MRSKKRSNVRYSLDAFEPIAANYPYTVVPRFRPIRVITVPVRLPLSIANIARKEVYPYPMINQKRLARRALRANLVLPSRRREKWISTKVRIALPGLLPIADGSMVSLDRGRLTVHSTSALKKKLQREPNRRRYQERKSNRRSARNGQLDSPGALRHGLVAKAFAEGGSIGRIADAALVARAFGRRF